MAKVKDIKPENLVSDDIVIAVMGPTGAGKSNFINVATRQTGTNVGHKLQSCTSDVRAVQYIHPDGPRYVIIDTPGFDDTNVPDTEILSRIAQYLKNTYKRDIHLAGIVYLHRISDNRMAGSPLKNLRMFAKLCGDDAIGNVILATTMWDRTKEDVGSQREAELKTKYWHGMLAMGSQVHRFRGTFESAWTILDSITRKKRIHALLLHEELDDFQRQLSETQAGAALYNQLQKLLAEQKETLRKLRDEAEAENNEELVEELTKEYDTIQKSLQSTFDQITKMKVPWTRRLSLFFRKKPRTTSTVVV
jgi:GTPase Era involved in 16S rRNA processing